MAATPKKQEVKGESPASTPWVLIVEDDLLMGKALGVKFSYEKISTKIAEDGEAALDILKSGPLPSVVLLDLILPQKNGFEVLEEMKKAPDLKKIPVIVLSNLGDENDRQRSMELGAAEYLVKANVKIADVISKVKSYL